MHVRVGRVGSEGGVGGAWPTEHICDLAQGFEHATNNES